MTQDYGSRTDVAFLTLTDNSLPIYMKMKDEVVSSKEEMISMKEEVIGFCKTLLVLLPLRQTFSISQC